MPLNQKQATTFAMEKFRQDLEEINFPMNLIDAAPLEDILLKPGMGRLRLLQWCLSNVSSKVSECLLVNDDQLEFELLKVASNFGLCSKSEEGRNVFLGIGSVKYQTAFWNKVFDFVKSVQGSTDAVEHNLECYKKGSQFIREIVDSSDFEESLSVKMNLIPVEMQIAMNGAMPIDGSAAVEEAGKDLLDQLRDVKEQRKLNPIADTSDFTRRDMTSVEFESNTDDLMRHVGSYNDVYREEFEPLPLPPAVDDQPPVDHFRDLSDSVNSVRQHLDAFKDFLVAMEPLTVNEYRHLESSFDNHYNRVNELSNLIRQISVVRRP